VNLYSLLVYIEHNGHESPKDFNEVLMKYYRLLNGQFLEGFWCPHLPGKTRQEKIFSSGLLDHLDRGSTVILNVLNYQTARLDIPKT
jgi:hypothetical protein